MLKSYNGSVEVCTLIALSNANSPLGSNLCILRSKYEINFQSHSLAHCIKVATTVEQLDSQSNGLILTINFSIYINDLPTSTTLFNMIMYADDTTLYCDIKDVPTYENVLNVELCKITNWLAANKLSLNVDKTKFMVFHSDKKKVVYPKLLINNIEIERVDYFNFLGLQLNHNLNWNKHVNYVSLKISKFLAYSID